MKPALAVLGLLGAGALLGGLALSAARTAPAAPFLLGGIQVNEADHGRWFDALEEAGMNTVSVTTYARQADWDSDRLWFDGQDPGMLAEIRGARAHGLHVVLIPRVALDHAFERNRFLWHGLIMPHGEPELDAWFEAYRAFVLHWAAVAEREGVDVLAVGSELSSLTSTRPVEELPPLLAYYLDDDQQAARRAKLETHADALEPHHLWVRGLGDQDSLDVYLDGETGALREWAARVSGDGAEDAVDRINRRRASLEAHWRALIADVRRVYRGRLTYAANFDQFREVGFWEDLDLIGINAYFPLREPRPRSVDDAALYAALERGWSEVLGDADAFRDERGLGDRSLLFTEIGYTTRRGTTLAPWAGTGFSLVESAGGDRLVLWEDEPEKPVERALAFRALDRAHRSRGGRLLQGLLYWKLSTEPAHREVEPFVHVLGQGNDPLARELRRFTSSVRASADDPG